jgi:thymidylate synthase
LAVQVPGTQQHVDALKTVIAGLRDDITDRDAMIVEFNTASTAWLTQLAGAEVTPDPADIAAAITDDALLASIIPE